MWLRSSELKVVELWRGSCGVTYVYDVSLFVLLFCPAPESRIALLSPYARSLVRTHSDKSVVADVPRERPSNDFGAQSL